MTPQEIEQAIEALEEQGMGRLDAEYQITNCLTDKEVDNWINTR